VCTTMLCETSKQASKHACMHACTHLLLHDGEEFERRELPEVEGLPRHEVVDDVRRACGCGWGLGWGERMYALFLCRDQASSVHPSTQHPIQAR
jgi:hypothetical protein